MISTLNTENLRCFPGNDNLHAITSRKTYQLVVQLTDFKGETRYEQYTNFTIADESNKYRMTFGSHRGDAGRAGQGRAGQGRAGQGRAGQGRAGQGRAGQGRAGQGRAGQGRAGQGRAGQGRAGQGRAGQGRAGQGRAGQGRAGQGRAGQGRAGQGRAGQGRAGQGRAGQGRAGQLVEWKVNRRPLLPPTIRRSSAEPLIRHEQHTMIQ